MVEVGKLEIAGTINTAQIDAGVNRIRGGMKSISDSSKPVHGDLVRISSLLGKMSLAFVGLGLAGTGMMTTLAKGSPAVAGAMAKIKVKTGELSRSLGRTLKPAFDFAADTFSSFVDSVENAEGPLGWFVSTVIEGWRDAMGGLAQKLNDVKSGLEKLREKSPIIDKLFKLVGSMGKGAVKLLGPEITAGLIGAGGGALAGAGVGAAIGAFGGPIGALGGAGIGALIGGLGAAGLVGFGRDNPVLGFNSPSLFGMGPFGWNPFKKMNRKYESLSYEDII